MQTKSRLLLLVFLMLFGLGIITIVNVSMNFRDYSIASAVDKAKMTANIVKDGLTAHMVNGIMDKRSYFLSKIEHNENIESLWIVRSQKVTKQFGSPLSRETLRDVIDKKVIKSGIMEQQLTEDLSGATLRITIPYKASVLGTPNCLTCHDVQDGDTLGAISMEFNISKMRNSALLAISHIILINIIFMIVILLLLHHYVSPYMKLFETLQIGIKKAYKGDFTHEFKTTVTGDGKEFVDQINPLFRKIQETFGDIKYNLSTFIPQNDMSSDDPLHDAKIIISELSDIYKFKKTIELDKSKEVVYERLVNVFQNKFDIKECAFYEVNAKTKQRKLIYLIGEDDTICNIEVDDNTELCRAYRTKNEVISSEFVNLCLNCNAQDRHYICIPFSINNDNSLILSVTSKDEKELNRVNNLLSSIENYFEAAKPVIESKILMEKLLDTSLRDAMTGLYNRRFLDEFVDKVMSQAIRNKDTYSILMLDVDFFKMVNDTYGHDVGDKVIVEIGKLVRGSIRASDLGIRYGGEEFVIMLHNANNKGTMKIAEAIHTGFSELIFDAGNGETLQKTMSIGVSKFPNDGNTIWKCIKFADTALYVAKTTGRNKIVNYKKEMSEGENVR